MKDAALAVTLAVLSACSAESGVSASSVANAPVSAEAPSPVSKAKAVEEKGELLEFTYSWPAEASAIPALNARLEADLAKQRMEAMATAVGDKKGRPPTAPFNPHYLQKVWTDYGSTPALLSMAAQIATFTGGAHGNTAFDSILWDRTADRAIGLSDIFIDPTAALAALRDPYCEALDRARVEKRQAPLPLEGEDWLIGCPQLTEQVIVPVDADADGRFERLRVLIPPYEAGPYVEGKYEVDVPITEAVRELIKAEYRAGF